MIIGLSGYARSGKDTAAEGLQALGFQRVAFADKLREFIYRLDPVVVPRSQPAFSAQVKPATVREVIDEYGWSGYKETPYSDHLREYLQRLGTECGRELISDNIWIDAALGNPAATVGDIVVTDCRFPNEAQAIKDRGGYIVRIERPGVNPVNPHPSETSLDDWPFDIILFNSDSVASLHEMIKDSVKYLSLGE